MEGDADLQGDDSAANTFISLILVTVVLVLASTVWVFVLDIEDNTPSEAPNAAFGTDSNKGKLVLKHTSGDAIGPDRTDYVGITGNKNITVDWNDNVTNSTARPSDREAVVTSPITAGTEIAVVSNASPEDSLRFVWFAVDGTGYTLLSDFMPPGGTGGGSNSVGGSDNASTV